VCYWKIIYLISLQDQPYHYRRRARLSINLVKGELFVGFRQSESNQIVNIENCPILVKQLNDLLIPLQSCLRQIKQKKTLGHIELIAVDSGIILVLRHTLPLSELDSQLLIQFAEVHNISLYFHALTGSKSLIMQSYLDKSRSRTSLINLKARIL